jgi:hypothetical protein
VFELKACDEDFVETYAIVTSSEGGGVKRCDVSTRKKHLLYVCTLSYELRELLDNRTSNAGEFWIVLAVTMTHKRKRSPRCRYS